MNVQALDDKGRFYLIYTDVKSFIGSFKDTHNYLVTAEDIHGPWSEPIYLNSSGFDPSLFHDRDGRKYLVNMVMDHRSYSASKFAGIVLQEYSEAERKLVGPKKVIFKGSHLGVTEGPHLYWKDGYYYLMTAEGGTGYHHAVTVARSRNIDGPYSESWTWKYGGNTGSPVVSGPFVQPSCRAGAEMYFGQRDCNPEGKVG